MSGAVLRLRMFVGMSNVWRLQLDSGAEVVLTELQAMEILEKGNITFVVSIIQVHGDGSEIEIARVVSHDPLPMAGDVS